VHVSSRKPGAMQPARRMAKAIYSMKIELLFRVNETVIKIWQLMNCKSSNDSTDLSFACIFNCSSHIEWAKTRQ